MGTFFHHILQQRKEKEERSVGFNCKLNIKKSIVLYYSTSKQYKLVCNLILFTTNPFFIEVVDLVNTNILAGYLDDAILYVYYMLQHCILDAVQKGTLLLCDKSPH